MKRTKSEKSLACLACNQGGDDGEEHFKLFSNLQIRGETDLGNHASCFGHKRPNGRGELEQAVRGLGWGCKQARRQYEAGVSIREGECG